MENLNDACVLLLEDEYLIALDAEQILRELGVRRIEMTSTLREAEERAREVRFDLALLDVNVNGQMSFDLAKSLRARGVPIVFTTGYELKERGIPEVDSALCVSKPYTSERLRQVLCAAIKGSGERVSDAVRHG